MANPSPACAIPLTVLLVLAAGGCSQQPTVITEETKHATALENLKSPDLYKRGDALFVLQHNWDPAALDGVIATLDVPVHSAQAATILLQQPDERGLQAVIAKARIANSCPWLATVGAGLAQSQTPAAAEALREAAETRNLGLVAGGVRFFLALNDPAYDQLLVDAYRACPAGAMSDAITWSKNENLKAMLEKARIEERDAAIEKYRDWQKRNAPAAKPPTPR